MSRRNHLSRKAAARERRRHGGSASPAVAHHQEDFPPVCPEQDPHRWDYESLRCSYIVFIGKIWWTIKGYWQFQDNGDLVFIVTERYHSTLHEVKEMVEFGDDPIDFVDDDV